jgi:hypothetical protein
MSKITLKKKGKMYECQVFFPAGYPKKWKYVTNLESFTQFLNRNHSSWKYFNVYEKGSKNYLKRFYPGNLVPKVLTAILLLLTLNYPYENTSSETTSSTSINGFNNSATISTSQTLFKLF